MSIEKATLHGSTGTGQLDAWCRKNVRDFLGVFASDQLPPVVRPNNSLIVNYDPSDKPGSHWCSMYFPLGKPAVWFDSYGYPPGADALRLHDFGTAVSFPDYMRKHSFVHDTYVYSGIDLQSHYTDVCGEYSCLALAHGIPLHNPGWWRKQGYKLTAGDSGHKKNDKLAVIDWNRER